MVDGLVKIHLEKFKSSGAQLVMGEAVFTGPKTVHVRLNDGGTRTLTGERVFLNLGTRAVIPNVPGLADAKPLTHVEMLELDRVPRHLVVLGGGYVGLEFAQAFRRFGSRVTVIQHGRQLLAGPTRTSPPRSPAFYRPRGSSSFSHRRSPKSAAAAAIKCRCRSERLPVSGRSTQPTSSPPPAARPTTPASGRNWPVLNSMPAGI